MARPRSISPERQRAAFIQAGQREIARGGRPLYRIRKAKDGTWSLEGNPWLRISAASRAQALRTAPGVIAELLEVTPDRFDVEVEDADVTTLTPPKRDGQMRGG